MIYQNLVGNRTNKNPANGNTYHKANEQEQVHQDKEGNLNVPSTTESTLDVRETMRVLPEFLQYFLTWLTGKPLYGQKPLINANAPWYLFTALTKLIGGVAASIVILNGHWAWWPLLALSWIFTVSGARTFHATIIHHCVHYNFTGSKKIDYWIVELLSTILMIQDFKGYRYDHVSMHHSKKLATLEDPDLKFLLVLGIRPGMTTDQLWKRLVNVALSGYFHFIFLKARLAANFGDVPIYRKLMAVVFNLSFVAFAVLTDTWLTWIVAWVFPITILYHISALLQFVSEHRWLQVKDPKQPGKLTLARLTAGRFMGEKMSLNSPLLSRRVLTWSRWAARMIFIHLPARLFVIVGDLPQHDWHHRNPTHHDWANAAYARQRELEAGCPGWPEQYTEVWGLSAAIDSVFEVMSNLKPLNEDIIRISFAETADILRGM